MCTYCMYKEVKKAVGTQVPDYVLIFIFSFLTFEEEGTCIHILVYNEVEYSTYTYILVFFRHSPQLGSWVGRGGKPAVGDPSLR